LVFGTLHTTGAARPIDRLTNAFPTNQQEMGASSFRQVLQAVISQLLIPRIDKPGRVAGVRDHDHTPSMRGADSRQQNVPHSVGHPDRLEMGHDDAGRVLIEKYLQGYDRLAKRFINKSQGPTTIMAKIAGTRFADRGHQKIKQDSWRGNFRPIVVAHPRAGDA